MAVNVKRYCTRFAINMQNMEKLLHVRTKDTEKAKVLLLRLLSVFEIF